MPWPGVGALLRVVAGTHPDEAFGPPDLIGHHANWAARAYGIAVAMSGTVGLGQT